MLKPAVSPAAAGCEIVVNPLGSGPWAGTLIALTICGAFWGDGSVAAVDPDADPVGPPCELELFRCSSTTVAAPAPAPMITSATMAIFHHSPDRWRGDGV